MKKKLKKLACIKPSPKVDVKVEKHIVVFAETSVYTEIAKASISMFNLTLDKEQLMRLTCKAGVLILEFDVADEESLAKLEVSLETYANTFPSGAVVYAMILESKQLIIKPTLFYSPTRKVNFGK